MISKGNIIHHVFAFRRPFNNAFNSFLTRTIYGLFLGSTLYIIIFSEKNIYLKRLHITLFPSMSFIWVCQVRVPLEGSCDITWYSLWHSLSGLVVKLLSGFLLPLHLDPRAHSGKVNKKGKIHNIILYQNYLHRQVN